MKKKLLLIIFPMSIFIAACNDFDAQSLLIREIPLIYRVHQKSLPGKYFFTLNDMAKIYKRQHPVVSDLITMNTEGKVLFQRTFEHRYRIAGVVDFRPIEPGVYSYFMAGQTGINSHATLHFLSQQWNDLYLRDVPNRELDFDLHDVLRADNGNYFFIFYHNRVKEGVIDYEIQEWNSNGQVVFTWNTKDHLKVPKDVKPSVDPFHLNSISFSSDGKLLVSLCDTSEIAKVDYPSGKVLWRMSFRDWKFPGDSLGGFRFQHSVRGLPSGNILLFDNGDGRGNISRAVEYQIDEKNKSAKLIWEYRNQKGNPFRDIQGSVQRLSNGHTLVGWGAPQEGAIQAQDRVPLFSEVDAAGTIIREMLSQGYNVSYRVYFEETK